MTCEPNGNTFMKTIISKRWHTALRVTACTLVILACQLPCLITPQVGVPANPDGNTGPSGQPTSEATPASVVFGPGPFNLMDPTVGLTDLSSYKATLIMSYQGTQSGQPNQWSHTYVMLVSQENSAQQISFEAAGGDPAPFLKMEINSVDYSIDADKNCAASPTDPGNSLSAEWEPAGFLSALVGAEAAGSEVVNGVASEKYTFDERALGEPGFTQSTGQIWVAADKGYVVRYLLTTTAGADYFGEGNEGTITSEYNLSEVNMPVFIDLPASCPEGALVDAPMMPSAQGVVRLPGVTIYSTEGSIQDVVSFYQEQLPSLGWESPGDPVVDEAMGTVIYSKGDQSLTVIVTPSGNLVEVRLVMGPALTP
jgi:hypothetical protein